MGRPKAACSYFLTELVLHYALVLICMAIAIVLKNNVISMDCFHLSDNERNEYCIRISKQRSSEDGNS